MIPASISIAFNPKEQTTQDSVAYVKVRGTLAESMHLITFVPVKHGDHQYAAGKALKQLGNALIKGNVEFTTEARNHGLPPHMLRVAVELDQVNTWLDGLNSMIGEWPNNLNERFKALPMIDQTDLLEQQEHMAKYAKVLNKRLERARAERDA